MKGSSQHEKYKTVELLMIKENTDPQETNRRPKEESRTRMKKKRRQE